MNTEDIDKIIADALEEDKKNKHKSKFKFGNGSGSTDGILKARKILNIVFMIGFVAAIIIYVAFPENKPLFFCVGFGAMLLKIVEFFLRFMF